MKNTFFVIDEEVYPVEVVSFGITASDASGNPIFFVNVEGVFPFISDAEKQHIMELITQAKRSNDESKL